MEDVDIPGPAPYSPTDEAEVAAVDTFQYLLDHKRVKADVRKRDKDSNTDGHVELVDEKLVPMGRLEVQVKKLPDNAGHKYQCKLSLFSYSEITGNPVLLIGVDVNKKKAYWFHVDKEYIHGKVAQGQQTIVVSFPAENVVDGSDTRYLEEWKNLVEVHLSKIREYNKMKDTYNELVKKSNPALGLVRSDFLDIHSFLDELNQLLEGEFSIVKRRMYPGAWKIGLAYLEYSPNLVSYTLYPIPLEMNDVQIKQSDKELANQLLKAGLGFTGIHTGNPIKERPIQHAQQVIRSDILRILSYRLLDHDGNEFLATEYVFAFIDRFHVALGLEQRDSYTVSEISNALISYLPAWVDETVKFLVTSQRNGKTALDFMFRKPYFDPDMLTSQVSNDELRQIDQHVRQRLSERSDSALVPIGNESMPVGLFLEFVNYLRSKNTSEITKKYRSKDYSRLAGRGGFIWGTFSPDAVEFNLKTFFTQLPDVYHAMVSRNFPALVQQLSLFQGISRVVIIFDVKDRYASHTDAPTIQFLYLRGEEPQACAFDIYRKGSTGAPRIPDEQLGRSVDIDGKRYEIVSMSKGVLDFIFDDTPMLNYVYKIMEENLKAYFDEIVKDIQM